jgi:hypothetical protein
MPQLKCGRQIEYTTGFKVSTWTSVRICRKDCRVAARGRLNRKQLGSEALDSRCEMLLRAISYSGKLSRTRRRTNGIGSTRFRLHEFPNV